MLRRLRWWLNSKSDLTEEEEHVWTKEEEQECLEYDLWKDAYREAFAEYEDACKRKDWLAADRWFKRFICLWEPRRRMYEQRAQEETDAAA